MDPSMVWRQRAVIIHRDENGYGLTVFGDNPVSVQTIKQGGAAELAGIREGDIIVKVNGTLVEHMTHTEVVNLIKSAGAYVTLTVKPPGGDSYSPQQQQQSGVMPSVGFLGGNGGRPHHHLSTNERVTAPLPVNQDVQLQMQGCKIRTLQAMRDKAAIDVEKLWKKYEVSGDQKDMSDFEKAQQNLKKIESQMKSFRQNSPNLQLQSPTPFSQFSQVHHSVPFQPQRNRNPLSNNSHLGGGPMATYQNVSWMSEGDHAPPPPLPPRTHQLHQQYLPPDYPPSPLMGGYLSSNHTSFNNLNQGLKHYPNNHEMLTKSNSSGSGGGSSGHNSHSQQQLQTHHRAKSSPDPVSMQKALNSEGSKRSDSFNDLNKKSNSNSRSRTSGAWDSVDNSSNQLSPPGSPPPPYPRHPVDHNNSLNSSSGGGGENHNHSNVSLSSIDRGITGIVPNRQSQFSPVDIIAMEEDDGIWPRETSVPSIIGFQGPYSSLSRLLEHNAHLAVFINYVIDNRRDPSSLLFYLITAFDIEEGSLKEMKRWGYEIHSTFTAPGAPLLVPNVDESIARKIDDALLNEEDKEEMMRRVFRKARNKAKEEINKQLEEFCNKRTAGLGSMYGPPDNQLEESLHNKEREKIIVETYLVPRVEQFNTEIEMGSDGRTFAIMIAVATVIVKLFSLRTHVNLNNILEKHGSFMCKDKSMKSRFISKPKKVAHNGHHFVLQSYSSYMECNVCSKLLWGIGPQGQQCVDCNLNIHRSVDTYRTHNCINEIHDSCLGTNQKNKNDRFRRFKERIIPEKDPKKRISKKLPDDNMWGSFGDADTGEKPLGGSGLSGSSLKGDRRPDTLSEERLASDGFTFEDDIDRVHNEPKKSTTAVGRSESCKERVQKKHTRERRKHSDPNLTSKSTDVDLDTQRQLSDANNSGSSSNSSLSARYLTSLESPSTSQELVAPSNNSSSSLRGDRNSETPETTVGGHSGALSDSYKPSPGWDGDSDIEVEQDPPDWTKNVAEDALQALDRQEKKRQEVINELFHTERSHVRNLKVVDRLFHRPIRHQQLLPVDLIQMLFANLDEILEIHGRFNSSLKKLRMESPLVGDIGPVLLEMFEGESGDNFKRAAATFCAKQQIGLEILRDRRRKDPKFNAFLTEAESDPVCRRLGIKDMIPMAMQRLTKYPLLFENLCNCAPKTNEEEYKNIQRSVELSKEILCYVNHAKKEAEDQERLIEIQRKLDKSAFDKGIGFDKNDPSINEIRNLDFTKHWLIHEGPLMWRMTKSSSQKSNLQEVQAVLLNDMIVILMKQDDRYVLKIHNMGFPGKSDRMMAKPIIKLNNLHIRPVATDKRGFFLISTTSSNMYELVCSSPEERNAWFHHITKAADDYKNRQESRRSENLQPVTNIPAVPTTTTTTNHLDGADKSKDSNAVDQMPSADSEGEKEPPMLQLTKEGSPMPESTCSDPLQSPSSPEKSGDGKLSVGSTKLGRSVSASPSAPRRKQGEFLHITESSPLIDPSEVTVTSRDVHFAQPVLSPYEELKRADSMVQKALEEKLRIASKIFHIPQSVNEKNDSSGAKDAKELLVACIHSVDRLIGLVSSQKVTKDNMESYRVQQVIHDDLTRMLTHVLSEFERKDDELEQRRQELHRVREQNHGYQERLHGLLDQRAAPSSPSAGSGGLTTPTLSPPHSRPSSFLSSSSDQRNDDDAEVVGTVLSKQTSSDPVVTSNSEELSDLTNNPPPIIAVSKQSTLSADSAPEEFADTSNQLAVVTVNESDECGEKNRESTETEVMNSTKDVPLEKNVKEDKVVVQHSSSEVPETNGITQKLNGHSNEESSGEDQHEKEHYCDTAGGGSSISKSGIKTEDANSNSTNASLATPVAN